LRWILEGAKAPAGQKVKLEAVRIGHRWLTSLEAMDRFAAAQTPGLDPRPTPRSPAARRRAHERAERELEKSGI
jgi:hypothetical protein